MPVNLSASAALGRVLGPFPEDRGAAFGADDRIIGVFEHRHPVAQADPQGASGPAFADHQADDRRIDPAHRHQRLGDRQGLPSLLGGDPGIGAGSVDEGDDWQAELGRHLHLEDRLAIPFGMGAAEVAGGSLGERPPLLVADEHAPSRRPGGQTR